VVWRERGSGAHGDLERGDHDGRVGGAEAFGEQAVGPAVEKRAVLDLEVVEAVMPRREVGVHGEVAEGIGAHLDPAADPLVAALDKEHTLGPRAVDRKPPRFTCLSCHRLMAPFVGVNEPLGGKPSSLRGGFGSPRDLRRRLNFSAPAGPR